MKVVVLLIIAVIILFVLVNIRIVPQSKIVIERSYAMQLGTRIVKRFIDRVAKNVSLKEQVVDFKPQPLLLR
ncbi:MAG: hypothetical protein ACLR6O_04945 [Eubacterium sp.]